MNAEQSFPALAAMMGSCFHQDMDLEAETVPEAVALYARSLSPAAAGALRAEIDSFRQRQGDDLDGAFLLSFGEDLDPRDAGVSPASFLDMVAAVVEDPGLFRQFLDADLRPEFLQIRLLARACLDLPGRSGEARRLGLAGADSLPHALALYLSALAPDRRQALLTELDDFGKRFGKRATTVFAKRWLDLATGPFEDFPRFHQAVERIAANPEDYRSFAAA